MDICVKKQLPYLEKILSPKINGTSSRYEITINTFNPKKAIEQLSQIDPSENKCNLHTFCTWIANGSLIWPEDYDKLDIAVEDYQIAKAKYPQLMSISKFKSLQELTKMTDKLLYPEKLREEKKGIRIKEFLTLEGVKPLYFEKADAILEISNPKTMSKLAKGTKWCVANVDTAQTYLVDNEVLYLLISKGKKHSLWHFRSSQVMNIHDEPLFSFGHCKNSNAIVDKMLSLFKDSISTCFILKKRNKKMEPTWIKTSSPADLYWYAEGVIRGRWKKAENVIKTNPEWAYWYAVTILKERWLEAEDIIRTQPTLIYDYSKEVMKTRWVDAENFLKKSPQWYNKYSEFWGLDRTR